MKLFINTCQKILLPGLIYLLILACSDDIPNNPKPNQPPETQISFFTDKPLNAGISRQTFYWWGDDPDGIVIGFIYTFDENAANVESWNNEQPNPDWTFTTSTNETFNLELAGADTIYTFQVKAVDDYGAADPTPAIQKFPIINTSPIVQFPAGTDVPETTFTVATFSWSAADLDGDDTIAKFQYVLDDTTRNEAWIDLDAKVKSITLTATTGLTEGEHVFFLRAVDIAGASSPIIRMPRSQDDTWYVRQPKGTFLVIDDYNIADGTDAFYQSLLSTIVGTIDLWDIKSNNRALEPPSSKAFTETLLLFDRIFWYADAEPNLGKAQVALSAFLDNNGKIIMTTAFQEFTTNLGDPLEFSPVDSLGTKISRITRNQIVQPSSKYFGMGFPELKVNKAIIANVFPLVPKISSDTLYVLPERPGSWPGTPVLAVIDARSSFVFFGLPLVFLNGSETVALLIETILNDIFQDEIYENE